MRYVVLDTSGDRQTIEIAGFRATVLGTFHSEASARALALQRMAYGDRGIIVVDTATGMVVYDPTNEVGGEQAPAESGTRRKDSAAPDEASDEAQADQRNRSR